ncbi:MAG: M20 family metallopeptidase [Dehalobacterium sp.]
MSIFLARALEIKNEMIENRRFLHRNAEIRDDLPITADYVKKQLIKTGIEPVEICKNGIVALIGKKQGKTVMLRADMDALDMKENSGLPFSSQTPYAHCCGHDLHIAMLLGAAKILKEREHELNGVVKLMFQPGEEYFIGSKAMLDAGLLENPKVHVAVDMHVNAGNHVGTVAICKGYTCASCDGMKLIVNGKGCHGAWPHNGIDPINVAAHIYLSLQALIARETPPDLTATLTFGQFAGGNAANIIPSQVVMQGTMRTFDRDLRAKLSGRVREIVDCTAKAFGASVDYEVLSDVPALITNPELLDEMLGYLADLGVEFIPYPQSSASDDFARISEQVPSVFFSLGCRPDGDGPVYPAHNPKIIFNEDALPIGAALHAQCAYHYLKNH